MLVHFLICLVPLGLASAQAPRVEAEELRFEAALESKVEPEGPAPVSELVEERVRHFAAVLERQEESFSATGYARLSPVQRDIFDHELVPALLPVNDEEESRFLEVEIAYADYVSARAVDEQVDERLGEWAFVRDEYVRTQLSQLSRAEQERILLITAPAVVAEGVVQEAERILGPFVRRRRFRVGLTRRQRRRRLGAIGLGFLGLAFLTG